MRALHAGHLALLTALMFGLSGTARALDLPLPEGAVETADVTREADTIRLPTGPYENDTVPRLRRDGDIHSRAWRLPDSGRSTLQILAPLRAALDREGWSVIFDCASDGCGGFGFRVALPVLPAPAMFIDLFDFRYLLATRGAGAETQHLALIVSARGGRGYVQATYLRPATLTDLNRPVTETGDIARPAGEARDLAERLHRDGYAVLAGLDFASGAATLGPGPHDSLSALAEMLRARPELMIALVGHTDDVGGLDANIALSRARAEAVRDRLVGTLGAARARIAAYGVGYLAPRGPNDTDAGRDRNRRVEVVIVSGA